MIQEEEPSTSLYDSIYVARQPVFTTDMRIWGYELLFRHSRNVQTAVITDGDQATNQVIADGFNLASSGMRKGARALINFPRNVLLGGAPYVLPPERVVVEILETVEPDRDVLETCRELKHHGYILALDDFVGQPGFEKLCALADIIKVDILQKTPTQVRELVRALSRFNATLLAEKVENLDMFTVCTRLGFTYFQGFFFSKPEIIPGRKLSAGQITKVKLLRELNDPETELERLVTIIRTDLSISYRLLQYINSARFYFSGKIESIQRAATMLGKQNLRQWLQVIILSDINTSDKAQELVSLSVQRGRFLQLLSEHCATPFGSEGMFLLGFFSLLDAILDQYMEDVLQHIPLDDGIKRALSDKRGPQGSWVALLEELDRGRWSGVERIAAEIGIPFNHVGKLSRDAAVWTVDVMSC